MEKEGKGVRATRKRISLFLSLSDLPVTLMNALTHARVGTEVKKTELVSNSVRVNLFYRQNCTVISKWLCLAKGEFKMVRLIPLT